MKSNNSAAVEAKEEKPNSCERISPGAGNWVDGLNPRVYAAVKWISGSFFRLFYRAEIIGAENVPPDGPLLVVCNHASFFDPVMVGGTYPRTLHFLAKRELFTLPLLGRFIRALGAIPIHREGVDRRSLASVAKMLREGGALVIFPEGTRSRDGELQPVKPGVGFLATHLGKVKISPLYIEGTFDAWPRHRKFPRLGKIVLNIGPPFELSLNSDTRIETKNEEKEQGGQGEKKRLYWAAAEDIMRRIEAVRAQAPARLSQAPTSNRP